VPEDKKCPKCNSILTKSKVLMGLILVRNAGTELEPDHVIASDRSGAVMHPYLCGSCGFIELYVSEGTSPSSIGLWQDQDN
jgi:ribosomal protein S27AE